MITVSALTLSLRDKDRLRDRESLTITLHLHMVIKSLIILKPTHGWPEGATGENVCSSRCFNGFHHQHIHLLQNDKFENIW